MNKLTKVNAARPVSRNAAHLPSSAAAARVRAPSVCGGKTDASWIEIVDHIVFGARPVVGLAVEVMEGVKVGRVPLRAVVLTAMLVI
jgi:hypothetical protein